VRSFEHTKFAWSFSCNEYTESHEGLLDKTFVDCFAFCFAIIPQKGTSIKPTRKTYTMTSRPIQIIVKRALSTSMTRRAAPAVFQQQQQSQTSYENLSTVVQRYEYNWEELSDDVIMSSSRPATRTTHHSEEEIAAMGFGTLAKKISQSVKPVKGNADRWNRLAALTHDPMIEKVSENINHEVYYR
jgi:hypothetical protein